jgi:hypothetical protein
MLPVNQGFFDFGRIHDARSAVSRAAQRQHLTGYLAGDQ